MKKCIFTLVYEYTCVLIMVQEAYKGPFHCVFEFYISISVHELTPHLVLYIASII